MWAQVNVTGWHAKTIRRLHRHFIDIYLVTVYLDEREIEVIT